MSILLAVTDLVVDAIRRKHPLATILDDEIVNRRLIYNEPDGYCVAVVGINGNAIEIWDAAGVTGHFDLTDPGFEPGILAFLGPN